MLIKRDLLEQLRAHLDKPEITLLIGPRQAGKTTLMRTLGKELENNGERCHYFNLDIDTDQRLFSSQQHFVNHIAALTGEKKPIYLSMRFNVLRMPVCSLKGYMTEDLKTQKDLSQPLLP